jgi:acetoin utilization protein AcuB
MVLPGRRVPGWLVRGASRPRQSPTELNEFAHIASGWRGTGVALVGASGWDGGARRWGDVVHIEEAFGMLVHDIMHSRVVTVTPQTAAREALDSLRTRGIRHLVVVDGAEVVGIVSDRDVKQIAAQPERFNEWVVDDVMSGPVITIDPGAPVEDAARLMLSEKISALPVTQDRRLVGIVTETDVMRLFVRALGAGVPSSRLDVVVGTHPTGLADIVATVQASGAPVSSIVTLPNRDGLTEAVIRVATIDPRAAIDALIAKGYRVKTVHRGSERCDHVA